jgi:broad specificity phosphatase PhoE
MVRIVLVRPGSTDFDEQGRIKGTLDIPLSYAGTCQVARIVNELQDLPLDAIYSSPGLAAEKTADAIAVAQRLKVKRLDDLQNLDHGLWHGKLVNEVRHSQPRVYRQLLERPETVCPPQGEPVGEALERVRRVLVKVLKKHRAGTIALVVPEPLASLVRSTLEQCHVGDLWKAECECGIWQMIEMEPLTKELQVYRGAAVARDYNHVG